MVMMRQWDGGKWIGRGPGLTYKISCALIASTEVCTVGSTAFDRVGRMTEHQFARAVASTGSGSNQPRLVGLGPGPAGHQHLERQHFLDQPALAALAGPYPVRLRRCSHSKTPNHMVYTRSQATSQTLHAAADSSTVVVLQA